MSKANLVKIGLISLGVFVLIICVITVIFALAPNKKSKSDKESATNQTEDKKEISNPKFDKYTKELPSRAWMEYAMDIVREEKPTPPESSRFYAYVSIAYTTALENNMSDRTAGEAVVSIIDQIYPKRAGTTNEFLEYLHPYNVDKYGAGTNIDGKTRTILNDTQAQALKAILEREKTDGFYDLKWDGIIPTGEGKWVKSAIPPFSPTAGEWKRWIVTTDFKVPEPPKLGSAQDKTELEKVKKAVAVRTAEQSAIINFWGGVPGTEAPAGIWQNRMYDEIIKKDRKKLTDVEYAKYQSLLAQSLADSFMECWKTKYTYWTARPSMRIDGLNIAMNNPNFPSYVSGHSTISRTAAEVLGAFFPEKKELWLKDAMSARDSRLWAGIHFDVDNQEGFKLGEQIGKEIVSKLDLANLNLKSADQIDERNLITIGKMHPKTTTESHLNSREEKGDLFLTNLKSDTSKKFVVSISKKDADNVKVPSDWDLKNIGNDAIWVPGACSAMPTAFTGGKYIAMFDAASDQYPTDTTPALRLLSYDTEKKEFKYFIEQQANDDEVLDSIYSYTLRKSGDSGISYYFIPKENLVARKNTTGDRNLFFASNELTFVVKREINLATQSYKDYKTTLPNWPKNIPASALSFNGGSNEILISYDIDSDPTNDSFYKIVNNEVDISNKINFEFGNQYTDGYKLQEIAPPQGDNTSKNTVKLVDEKNNEYYREDTDSSFYSLGIVGATKDKVLLIKNWTGIQAVAHFEIGYLDLKTKTYIPGIKAPIKKEVSEGYTYSTPEFTFFVVGAL